MSSNSVDLTTQVEIENLSPEEINIILSGVTGGSTIIPEEQNVVVYGGEIKVLFKSNNNKILKISAENSFWKKKRTEILEAFHTANNPLSEKIYSRVVFAEGEELSTYPFRWRDEFQLGRPPEGNTKPEALWSLYPCLFQFKVPHTGNLRLDIHRSQEIFKKRLLPLIPLLRQYCMTHLQYDSKTSSKKAWALTESDEGVESEWLQLDYFFKSSFSSNAYHEYEQPEVKQLPVFEQDHYWLSSLNLSIGYYAYEYLSEENKKKFLLGCEWFNKAITAHEPTDQFLFIMIMLEIFLPKDSKPCEECKQPIYGINKKFKTYIPEIIGEDWTTDFEKILGQLYSLRSCVAHNGVAVAQHSEGLIPVKLKEQNQLRYLFGLGRQFLVSWLVQMTEKH